MTSFVKLAIMEDWNDDEIESAVKQMGQLTFWNNGEPLTQERINDIIEDIVERRAQKRRRRFTVVDGGKDVGWPTLEEIGIPETVEEASEPETEPTPESVWANKPGRVCDGENREELIKDFFKNRDEYET